MRRILLTFGLAFAFAACESKPPPEPEATTNDPGVPTIAVAPTTTGAIPDLASSTAPDAGAPEIAPQIEEAPSAESASRSGGAKSSAKDAIGSRGSGSGSGSGAGVGGLLEAKSRRGWTVHVLASDADKDAVARVLRRKEDVLSRCLEFLDAEATKLTMTVALKSGAVAELSADPDDTTAAECLRTGIDKLRLPGTKLQAEFRRSG